MPSTRPVVLQGEALRSHPKASARLTAWSRGAPPRKGRSKASRTSQSARSVAVESPAPAASAIRDTYSGRQVGDHAGHGGQERRLQACNGLERRRPCPPACPLHRPGAGPSSTTVSWVKRADAAGRPWRRISSAASGLRLLRHDRRAGGEVVRQGDEAELRRSPDHDLFGQTRQVHARQVAAATRVSRAKSRSATAVEASSPGSAGRSPSACRRLHRGRWGRANRGQGRGTERALVHAPRGRPRTDRRRDRPSPT